MPLCAFENRFLIGRYQASKECGKVGADWITARQIARQHYVIERTGASPFT